MSRALKAAAALCVAMVSAPLPGASPDGNAAWFGRIKSLQGSWEGPYQWSGARTDSGRMQVRYSTTGKGSAIVENLIVEGEAVMTTVYHLDNGALRMTHYCGAGNQPRLKAEGADSSADTVRFSFVDATNLASPAAPHVNGFEIRSIDADHVVLTFTFTSEKGVSYEKIDLRRSQPS
jgi:hypothetical protein